MLAVTTLNREEQGAARFLADVARHPAFPPSLKHLHQRFTVADESDLFLRVYVKGLLEDLAGRWLLPRSETWLQFPDQSLANANRQQIEAYRLVRDRYAIDVRRSVRRAGYRFLLT